MDTARKIEPEPDSDRVPSDLDNDPVWQAALRAPVGTPDELPPGLYEELLAYTPPPGERNLSTKEFQAFLDTLPR